MQVASALTLSRCSGLASRSTLSHLPQALPTVSQSALRFLGHRAPLEAPPLARSSGAARRRSLHRGVAAMAQLQQLSVQETAALVDAGTPYLDVRTEEEFGNGHPPGAINVPIAHRSPDGGLAPSERFLQDVADKFPSRGDQLIVGCQAGPRSGRAVAALQKAEYTNLVDVQGGFGAWSSAGLPVEK